MVIVVLSNWYSSWDIAVEIFKYCYNGRNIMLITVEVER